MYALYTLLLTAPVLRSSVCIIAAPWLRFSTSFVISSGVFSLLSASCPSFSTASFFFSSSLSLLPNSVTNFSQSRCWRPSGLGTCPARRCALIHGVDVVDLGKKVPHMRDEDACFVRRGPSKTGGRACQHGR